MGDVDVGDLGEGWTTKEANGEEHHFQMVEIKDQDLTTPRLQMATVPHLLDHKHTVLPNPGASPTPPEATAPRATARATREAAGAATTARATRARHTVAPNTSPTTTQTLGIRPKPRTPEAATASPGATLEETPATPHSTAAHLRITIRGIVQLGGTIAKHSLPLMITEAIPIPQHTMHKATLAPLVAVTGNRTTEQDILGNRTLVRRGDFNVLVT